MPKPEVKINNPDAGKIEVIVSGQVKVTSTNPRVVIRKAKVSG